MKWRCPICRKSTDSETSAEFPFCSERCKLLDLGNWSSEKYVISEPVLDESSPESPEPPADRDEDEREGR
ncbi:MAG TPA: DNA gyrase inhibitor YacG [Candidatus Limnocylindria bacterium]|nr:DNA gyrase inhibitor YacG [Candidatus Limnocylindria bacterium]